MAKQDGISTLLKRTLKDGKEYDRLIPRVKCERTNLGEGDTFFTVDAMKDWVETYAFQTAKLAPRIVGRNLEETVNNIYNFLYNHVQYEADGSLQQLRSPACTWAQRKTGVDCKSYSVFASAILSNLGIKHFIRQVRQPYFFPEEFTHVYVVVPKDQNRTKNSATFVLDATKHENVESNYLEKVDLEMTKLSHIGLNAPQDERTQQLIQNFERFCNELRSRNVPLSTVNAMRRRVSEFTSMGKDPSFKLLPPIGVDIEGVFFPVTLDDQGQYNRGLGFVDPVTAAAGGKALLNLLPQNFISDTFGAVFANGFNLSCWNSSSSPMTAKKQIAESIQPFFEACFTKIESTNNTTEITKYLNLAIEGAHKMSYLYNKIAGMSKYAKCSREGWKMMGEFSDVIIDHLDSLLASMGSNFTFTKKNVTTTEEFHIPANMTANNTVFTTTTGPNQVTYPQVSNLKAKAGAPKPQVPAPSTPDYGTPYQPSPVDNYNGSPGSGNGNSNGNNNGNNNENPGPNGSESSNTGLIIGGVALASLPLLFMMKKGSVSQGVAAAKKPAARKPAAKKSATRKTKK